MKLMIVTDAWHPQVNGVVTTLEKMVVYLRQRDLQVEVIEPSAFSTLALPNYSEISLAWSVWRFKALYEAFDPDCVHIATEGPLGVTARRYLVKRGLRFTTSLHTKFPEYINQRIGMPVGWGYRYLRWFHRPSSSILVTTHSMKEFLTEKGMTNLVVWGRGVDTDLFDAKLRRKPAGEMPPTLLYVGRVAVEKNIEAFLSLDVPGNKIVVGDGQARPALAARFPDAKWVGYKSGQELANYYANADVFVFPSKTDTFGIVMLEALASGTPVAGYPVTGPRDVILQGETGWLDDDLETAVLNCLSLSRDRCRYYALEQSWRSVADKFGGELVPVAPQWQQPNRNHAA